MAKFQIDGFPFLLFTKVFLKSQPSIASGTITKKKSI